MNLKLVKKQSKQTYKNKAGKECHYYNYYLVADNGRSVQVKPAIKGSKEDLIRLDCMAIYER